MLVLGVLLAVALLVAAATVALKRQRKSLIQWALKREAQLRNEGLPVPERQSSYMRRVANEVRMEENGAKGRNRFGIPLAPRRATPKKLSRKQAKNQVNKGL